MAKDEVVEKSRKKIYPVIMINGCAAAAKWKGRKIDEREEVKENLHKKFRLNSKVESNNQGRIYIQNFLS